MDAHTARSYWGGTIGFMPHRLRQLYSGLQPYPVKGVGEVMSACQLLDSVAAGA